MDSQTEITQSERNKVLALQLASRETTKDADTVVQMAEKFLAFLNK